MSAPPTSPPSPLPLSSPQAPSNDTVGAFCSVVMTCAVNKINPAAAAASRRRQLLDASQQAAINTLTSLVASVDGQLAGLAAKTGAGLPASTYNDLYSVFSVAYAQESTSGLAGYRLAISPTNVRRASLPACLLTCLSACLPTCQPLPGGHLLQGRCRHGLPAHALAASLWTPVSLLK